VANDDFDAVAIAKVLRQLFSEEDGAMLAAGAAEGDHQIGKAPVAISCDGLVDEGGDMLEVAMYGALLIQVFDYGRVLAG
jgi:hypothetical protein